MKRKPDPGLAIVTGDYSAKRNGSWLAVHPDAISWVQNFASGKSEFISKHVVACILDAVSPDGVVDESAGFIFPKDLPQQILKVDTLPMTKAQIKFLTDLNGAIIFPIEPSQLLWVLIAAQVYEKLPSPSPIDDILKELGIVPPPDPNSEGASDGQA